MKTLNIKYVVINILFFTIVVFYFYLLYIAINSGDKELLENLISLTSVVGILMLFIFYNLGRELAQIGRLKNAKVIKEENIKEEYNDLATDEENVINKIFKRKNDNNE